jgi:hypothetical protein
LPSLTLAASEETIEAFFGNIDPLVEISAYGLPMFAKKFGDESFQWFH